MTQNKHILYGVLNWGLGHATRSIPVINELLKTRVKVTIASDGLALEFLKKRFPEVQFVSLLPLNITYAENGSLVFGLAKKFTSYRKWYTEEKKLVAQLNSENNFTGIISDNRPTVYSAKISSVYLTHQWQIEAGIFSKAASGAHQQLAKKYQQIWVPDVAGHANLSGKLGHGKIDARTKFIGLLSDLAPPQLPQEIDASIILSGPEPQRTILENKLVHQLANSNLKITLVRGTTIPSKNNFSKNWHVLDVASRSEISTLFAQSQAIIARSGYSTLMDLYTHPKPAILIPTPGQPEQNYLAEMPLHRHNFVMQQQNNLQVIAGLKEAKNKFGNFKKVEQNQNWQKLFTPFLG